MEYYLDAWRNWNNYRGEATRKEYWMFVLINIIVTVVIGVLDKMFFGNNQIVSGIYGLLTIIPTSSIMTRRLHSIDKSGWWQLLPLLPVVGSIWLLILLVQKEK